MSIDLIWKLITAVGVVGTLAVGLSLKKVNDALKTHDKAFQAPQLRFRYTEAEAAACRAALGDGQRKLDQFSLLMAAMMIELLLVFLTVTRNICHFAWLFPVMYGLSGLACLAGLAETLVLKKQPKAAAVLSFVKWGAFGLWTACMFISLFLRSAQL